jgi:UDP-N-acetyl-D-glucosamine dehydrogenase
MEATPRPPPRVGGQFEHLAERLVMHNATVGVVGLGYAGLPLLAAALEAGFAGIGVDVDLEKVAALRRASPVAGLSADDLQRVRGAELGAKAAGLRAADVVIMAVPTPLKDARPDLSMVTQAAADVAQVLQPGRLVVLESTTYPGTTQEVVLPILEESGLACGRDFMLAYSPERIDPGTARRLQDVPKIVAGTDGAATELAELLYRQLGCNVVQAPSPREAEMAKLIENTFRQVNVSLVNELAMVAADLDVDIWAALDAAATKNFGYMAFWPGPGVGGHCIAVDPTYLSWRAQQQRGHSIGFVEHALAINEQMPTYVASRIGDALKGAGKVTRGARVLALGVSYKPGVGDTRESAAVSVIEQLVEAGAVCSYHDPFVPTLQLRNTQLHSQTLEPALVGAQDCVAILTAHASIDVRSTIRHAPLVFDAQGVTRKQRAPNVVLL